MTGVSGRIEDYALVGDLETAALVGRDGSVDWMCAPRFDSPACFAALLGSRDNGHWRLAPAGAGDCNRRSYRGDTLVLESVWETASGAVRLTDFMPPRMRSPYLVRIVEGISGQVAMRGELRPRFHHGRIVPWMLPGNGTGRQARAASAVAAATGMTAFAGPDALRLTSEPPLEVEIAEGCGTMEFTVSAGERRTVVLSWSPSYDPVPGSLDTSGALAATLGFWENWAAQCCYSGPWRDAVIRSVITLKALTYAPTGGMLAAATTSLPEHIGGERNWDYRYCWLRDSTFTLSCLLRSGFRDEAVAWKDWLVRAIAGDPADLQALYGVAGQRKLGEIHADWLSGYEGSTPVRIGNHAVQQLQLDVYGEVLNTFYSAMRAGVPIEHHVWSLIGSFMEYLEKHWRDPDEGLWEVRGPRRHFVHSKIMSWVAADRALRMARAAGLRPMVGRWRAMRQEIHDEVCRLGWDPEQRTFVQYYGSHRVDATALLIPRLGFLPAHDHRVLDTVDALGTGLDDHGFLRRYAPAPGPRTRHQVDGLHGGEGAFLACSFWHADALAATGRHADARVIFEDVLSVRNDVGLLSEEWDPVAGRQLGNTPQAFSHVALVNTAFTLYGTRTGDRR